MKTKTTTVKERRVKDTKHQQSRVREKPTKNGGREDILWMKADTQRIRRDAERERRERNRRLAERDAEYARLFPNQVRRGRLTHDVYNDEMSDIRRRYAG